MNARQVRGPADANAAAHVFIDALDDRCEIAGDDGHHLQRVRRLAIGEIVTAADGTGAWRAYEVAAVAPDRLTLVALEAVQMVPEPRIAVDLAVALTKGGLDEVVAAVTELGVDRVLPIRTDRVVVRWDATRSRRAVVRWRAVAREAAMQSRRVRIPAVEEIVELSELRERPGLVVADHGGVGAAELPPPPEVGGRLRWTVVVGPEGGFGTNDRKTFDSVPVLGLGANVLRARTAPIAAVAMLIFAAGSLSPE